jgi:hypothetical protein
MTACGCDVKKKDSFQCTGCNQMFCGKHIYYYIDEANIAITRNSRPYCETCYKIKYKKL